MLIVGGQQTGRRQMLLEYQHERRNEMSYGNEIEVNGVTYVRKDSCCDDGCCSTPPEPSFVDADGNEVKVGSEVRVRLSKLGSRKMDRDNRHGTVVAAGNGYFNVQFNHRLSSGYYMRTFAPTEIRVD